jgi:hypothetical protein
MTSGRSRARAAKLIADTGYHHRGDEVAAPRAAIDRAGMA